MMEDKYVTVTGMKYYTHPAFYTGDVLHCVKEPKNSVDTEAIYAEIPIFGKVGYVANTWHTKARGTFSAGRIYDTVGKEFFVELCFILPNAMIARVVEATPDVLERYRKKGEEAGKEKPPDLPPFIYEKAVDD
ncbi:MAG: hypothetical protein ACFWT7_07675 [Succiniclasticum sp.]|jgi:hypothetical protein